MIRFTALSAKRLLSRNSRAAKVVVGGVQLGIIHLVNKLCLNPNTVMQKGFFKGMHIMMPSDVLVSTALSCLVCSCLTPSYIIFRWRQRMNSVVVFVVVLKGQ